MSTRGRRIHSLAFQSLAAGVVAIWPVTGAAQTLPQASQPPAQPNDPASEEEEIPYSATPEALSRPDVTTAPTAGPEPGVDVPPAIGEERPVGVAPTAGVTEIFVTAQRRQESLQDVPISIDAFTGDDLTRLGVDDSRDLPLVSPGLVISQVGSAQVTLRGVSTPNLNLSGDPGVGIYIDDIYIARASAGFQDFFDVDRIEVLRGPQGTLFGRNTPGGVIAIYNRSPGSVLNGYGSFTYGNYDRIRAEGAIGGPVAGDAISARFAFAVERRDGYLQNLFDGEDVDDKRFWGLRGTVDFRPADNLTIVVRGDAMRDYGTGRPFKALTPGLANAVGGFSPFNQRWAVNIDEELQLNNRNRGISMRADWEFSPDWTFSSISGYRVHKQHDIGDLDDTELSTALYETIARSETLQQEFQITSSAIRGLDWVAGVFLWAEDANASLAFPFPLFGITPITLSWVDTFSIAGFAQGSYFVTDRLRLTAGIRFTRDEKEFRRDFSLLPIFQNVIDEEERSDNAWTPRFGIDYFLDDDVMLYANATRGFKSGGFNGAGRQPSYAPEFIWAYEAGLRSEFLNRQLRLNASVFYYDYTNVQVLRVVQAGSAIDNAASGTITGFEIDFTAVPSRNLSINVAYSYLDAEYDEYVTTDPVTGVFSDLAGNSFPRAPRHTATAAFDYEIPTRGGTLRLHGDLMMRSNIFFDQFNKRRTSERAIAVAGARASYRIGDGPFTVAAFVRNLTNQYYTESRFEIAESGGTVLAVLAAPRTFGLELRVDY